MRRLLLLLLALLLLTSCGSNGSEESPASSSDSSDPTADASDPADLDPDEPLSWGPTAGELVRAQELVAGWSSEQLAGGVIVGRFHGTDPQEPARMVRDLHLAGVQVTSSSISDEAQVRAMTAAVAQAHASDGREFPPIIGVDQEGGSVSHLSGIATDFPAFQAAGTAIETGEGGRRIVREAARTTGLELRGLGFTWVFAPVADVTIGVGDPTIGTRSPAMDPRTAAKAVVSAVRGYDEAGIVSTVKHFPGHGSVTTDSHLSLPVQDATLGEMESRDLVPFEAAIEGHAPAVMIGHLDVQALAPGVPSSLAPEVYAYLREDLGFEGVAITDSLGMGAVAGRGTLVVRALLAGADLLLMPADTAKTHELVVQAIEDGRVPRERVEDAATRVVALQRWQQRVADEVPVPADVAERAQRAAASLASAG